MSSRNESAQILGGLGIGLLIALIGAAGAAAALGYIAVILVLAALVFVGVGLAFVWPRPDSDRERDSFPIMDIGHDGTGALQSILSYTKVARNIPAHMVMLAG